ALHGDARLIADGRYDGDVPADERLPRSAVVEVDLQPTKRCPQALGDSTRRVAFEQVVRSDEVIE
ncbi:MAG: hypothetical protein WCB74_27775, partial [Pseudolabrys sp.]